jgi:predicted transcriptional regulator
VRKELNRLSLVNQALINRINGGHKFNEKQSYVNEVYQDTMILR